MRNENKKRSQKGITLLALVITIVIMIILATVAINFVFGEKGIITRAQESAEQAGIENVREKLEIAKGTAIIDGKGYIDPDHYFSIIEQEGIIVSKETDVIDNKDGTYEITTVEGYIFIITLKPTAEEVRDIEIEYSGKVDGPRIIKIEVKEKTTSSITIEVETKNAENGEYTYSYKKNSEDSWKEVETDNKSNVCTINNLEAKEIYDIRVEVAKGEKSVTREISVMMGEIPEGTITFEEVNWKGDGTASVVVRTSAEGYELQYQINGIEADKWIEITNGGTIEGLTYPGTAYARLWDGTNGSEYASISLEDKIGPTVEISTSNITHNSITANVTANDEQSGLAESETYKYYINNELKSTSTSNSYTFIELDASTSYTIKVEVIDKAGNITTEIATLTTTEPPAYVDSVLSVAPQISDGMIPVKYVEGTGWVKTDETDSSWYNYANKQWANIVLGEATFTKTGEQEVLDESKAYSMLVWIPRYAYKITSQYHTSGTGAGGIDIVFIDTENKSKDGSKTYSTTYPSATTGGAMSDYVVHPAFDYGGTALPGFWVGKFETSHTGCTTDSNTGSTNTNTTNLTAQIKAEVTSWRYIQVSNIFTVCRELNKAGNPYGLNSSDSIVDPHMMKNSEWGAVAYLSQNTTYGKGSEVWINNNTSYITGRAGDSVSESSSSSTGEHAYNTTNGKQASTTGNITGVYDMSGGTKEYVAAYVNNGNSNLTSSGSTLVSADAKYKDVYSIGSSDSMDNNYAESTPANGHYGDAVWEISSNSASSYTNSWYSDYSHFPHVFIPFFERGGSYDSNTNAGVFFFEPYNGLHTKDRSFRVVVPVL